MRSKWIRRLGFAAVLGAVAYGSIGCAEERDPINRVQPQALPKSFFVGADLQGAGDDPSFYARGTVVDVGYGASQDGLFTSTYAQPVARIKWEITERQLIGRLDYERLNDSDGKGVSGPKPNGIVAYAYPIESHFDIRRDYNASTGEEGNVIVENTSDRPWYEREFMRVDWSQNMSTDNYDFDTLSMMGLFGGIHYEPLAYHVTDPTDPNFPVFNLEQGYFDVTNKAFAAPQEIDLSHLGWGIDKFPSCMLPPEFSGGGEPVAMCSPVEITLRQSFLRVSPKIDYEPKDWDGYRFQAYGAFTNDRRGYARNFGIVDEKWHRFISRYEVWQRDHYFANEWSGKKFTAQDERKGEVECNTPKTVTFGADPNTDADKDGTADVCAAVTEATGFKGSQCDTFSKKCTLPYQARVAKPINWYVNVEGNLDYFEGSNWATHEWDVAMRSAIQTAKYAECRRVGTDAATCAANFPVYFGQQDENDDLIELAREVDLCRATIANASPEEFAKQDAAKCQPIADDLGGKRGYSAGVIATAKLPEMVALCHSPVEANDPNSCATPDKRLPKEITALQCQTASNKKLKTDEDKKILDACSKSINVRLGDLRYNVVNHIAKPQDPSAWGIMTDGDDPVTGRKIAASINIWTHINDLWSQGIVDQLRYIKKELSTEDITNGTNIADWAKASEAAYNYPKLTANQVAINTVGAAGKSIKSVSEAPKASEALIAKSMKIKAEAQGIRTDINAASVMRPIYDARRKAAIGSNVEAQLMTPAMQQYAGVNTAKLPNDLKTSLASVFQLSNPTLQRDMRNMREAALADRGVCVMSGSAAPLANAQLANLVEGKFGKFEARCDTTKAGAAQCKASQQDRAEKIRKYLAQRVHYAVMIHEMGHSIGLRHNFVSSSDPFNYRPQYWQLRTRNGTVKKLCTDLQQDGSTCVGPRYFDPVDQQENEGLIWMWMQSSVMDYAGEATQDLIGLGAYDFAAARSFYGDVVQVYPDTYTGSDAKRVPGLLGKMDNFGGILGLTYQYGTGNNNDIHYSQLQDKYALISDCKTVDPASFKPSDWDESKYGLWEPTLDGKLVKVNGSYSRCKTQQTDYVQWNALAFPSAADIQKLPGGYYRGGPSKDLSGRVRVPHGFATDRWADLGNLSVYRHDNGGDAYELFTFLQQQPEVLHIFNDYRRGRSTFSVRSAAGRYLSRYNEKLRDAAKGLGLLANIYRNFWLEIGIDFDQAWPALGPTFFKDNLLASGMAFDQFARQMARPESGQHYAETNGNVFRSCQDSQSDCGRMGPTVQMATIADGATGFFGNVTYGGKLLENALASDKGEHSAEYTVNVGSYYDKVYSSMLFTESVDNFISDSRGDFLDSRSRAVSLADLFPDGYRRWLGNNLTGDDFIKGVRVAAAANGAPQTDELGFASSVGWTSWWHVDGPKACFPGQGSTVCSFLSSDPGTTTPFEPVAPANVAVIDPQIGWEQQKFLIAMTLMYLPENNKLTWLDQMHIWEIGADTDPGFPNRIEFHHPSGKVYVAKTSGTESVFGKTVQKGVSARILQFANELLQKAYETDPIVSGGVTIGYRPKLNAAGQPIVKFDPEVQAVDPSGQFTSNPKCNATDNSGCTCSSNKACVQMNNYVSVPNFMRQSLATFRMASPSMKGLFDF